MAYLINLWAVQKANAVTVGSYIYLQPVLAGLFGLALGQESLQLEKIIFALLIFSGVYLVNKK
jgi:drug/metabolite transporter (DMT)-like permease